MFPINNFTLTCPVGDALMYTNRRPDMKETGDFSDMPT